MLEDLCKNSVLSFLPGTAPTASPKYFSDISYMLNQPQISRDFYLENMVTISPDIYCGILEIKFYNVLADESLANFFKVTSQNEAGQFVTQSQNVPYSVGTYPIFYRVTLKDYWNITLAY